jgi:phosphohistidine phosphatase SixA
MRLIVVRHAEAAPGDPDELRPLTAAGQDAARALGERLAGKNIDVIVTSPLLRARETAEAIARRSNAPIEIDDRLSPGATAATTRAAVEGKGETVVTVGHQPDCSEILLELTGREQRFAPASFAEVEL